MTKKYIPALTILPVLLWGVQACKNTCSSVDKNFWIGTYQYTVTLGKPGIEPGSVFLDYDLRIYESKDKCLVADIDVNGTQTALSIRARTRVEKDKIEFYFDHYREPGGPEIFKEDDFLFGLKRHHGKVVTYWGALDLLDLSHNKEGIYFEKIKPSPDSS